MTQQVALENAMNNPMPKKMTTELYDNLLNLGLATREAIFS